MTVDVPESPWRSVFEELRALVGSKRDKQGVLGSINWLRQEMEKRRANPNVVRNIIYRDKGKLADKRALFDIIKTLWQAHADTPLQAPELEALLSAESGAEQEVAQLLGREKRRAYSSFVSGVRSQQAPNLLITGRPGSGKTLLMDYIQQALELPPKAAGRLVRFDFSSDDLAASLTQFAPKLGLRRDVLETKLLKVSAQSAYAVQADAQADVARTLVEALKGEPPLVLMLHLSQSLAEQDSLSGASLRLNTADVPRVNAAEWLWLSLLEPLSHFATISLLVSMVNVPARALQDLGKFDGPIKLNPPTTAEARRFVKARLPQLGAAQQETIVQRAGRSFEELRTLTLLAEIRDPLPQDDEDLAQLEKLLSTAGDARLRDFLKALAVVSVPEFSTFSEAALLHLRAADWQQLSGLELAFLDAVPGEDNSYRCFSRRLARRLKTYFEAQEAGAYGALNVAAAQFYRGDALAGPNSEAATRYLYHLLEARDWGALESWLKRWSISQALLHRLWQQAESELSGRERFEAIALQVAAHYVRLGSYTHPDALRAFGLLASCKRAEIRLWTSLKQAEGAVLKGRIEEAEALLIQAGASVLEAQPSLKVESALIEASIARWRSDWQTATSLINETARPLLQYVPTDDASGHLIHAKVAVWAGLIAKDQGDLEGALREFRSVAPADELVQARIAFQIGDVLLQLGYFDEALGALNEAVQRAQRSEALIQEQTRFLARRARLHRLRAAHDEAEEDFAAALAILTNGDDTLELAFWRAKVDDERALLHLARGQFDNAIFALKHNQDIFSRYEISHGVDAGYRKLRSGLRLALAYGLRAHATPFAQPLTLNHTLTHGDLGHARGLLGQLEGTVLARAATGAPYGYLEWYTLLLSSLLAHDAEDAVRSAKKATELARVSYQVAESYAYLGAAYLRLGEADAVVEASRRGQAALGQVCHESGAAHEQSDIGLGTWLRSLELQARILKSDISGAAAKLVGLETLNPLYSEALLRSFGEALEAKLGPEARRHPAVTDLFSEDLDNASLRLPDALVAWWREVGHLREQVLA